ncbi:hypothetical protein NX059_000148 [Plenodomus lindquistii]|nr:hypothetical protein NX059_000148 [Plenodomus lindquistii]
METCANQSPLQIDNVVDSYIKLTTESLIKDVLDPSALQERCPLDTLKHGYAESEVQESLGAMQALPLEIQHQILRHAHLDTLLTFRRINKLAMNTVNSLIESWPTKAPQTQSASLAV